MARIALVLFAAVALAACGGDEGSSSASEEYANDACSSLSTWVDDIQSATKSLTDAGLSITESDVETAVDDVSDSTNTLADELEQLGAPESEDGRRAKTELESLAKELSTQVDAIEQALTSGGGAVAIAADVMTALSTAANALESTYVKLQGLDPAGELRDAFESADECEALGDQLESIGSDS